MSVTFNPNPNFGDDARKAFAEKLKAALSIRCEKHNQTGKIQVTSCCDDLERRIKEVLEKP